MEGYYWNIKAENDDILGCSMCVVSWAGHSKATSTTGINGNITEKYILELNWNCIQCPSAALKVKRVCFVDMARLPSFLESGNVAKKS